MKQFISLVLFLSVSVVLVAQPQFTASNCFQLNDASSIGFAVVSAPFGNQQSLTGSDYTWDFSSTGTPGPWTNWAAPTAEYVFQASSSSIHTPFLATQINEYGQLPFARDHFYSYSSASDTLYMNGFYSSSNHQYIPAIPYLSFPLSYSDSIHTHTIQNQGAPMTGSVTRYWIYDGFGTLVLPYGTANDVYRIRSMQVDSSYVLNSILSTNEEIIWFRQSDGIPVLRFVKQGETVMYAYYASASGATAISETKSNKLSVFPNPIQERIHVTLPNNEQIARIELLDMQGRTALQGADSPIYLDGSSLRSGAYMIQVTLEDGTRLQKRVVK